MRGSCPGRATPRVVALAAAAAVVWTRRWLDKRRREQKRKESIGPPDVVVLDKESTPHTCSPEKVAADEQLREHACYLAKKYKVELSLARQVLLNCGGSLVGAAEFLKQHRGSAELSAEEMQRSSQALEAVATQVEYHFSRLMGSKSGLTDFERADFHNMVDNHTKEVCREVNIISELPLTTTRTWRLSRQTCWTSSKPFWTHSKA